MNTKQWKIAQINHLAMTIPPENYGGTETVVAEISVQQAALGHIVYAYLKTGSTLLDYAVACYTRIGRKFRRESDRVVLLGESGEDLGQLITREFDAPDVFINEHPDVGFTMEVEQLRDPQHRMMHQLIEDDQNVNFDVIHCHAHGFGFWYYLKWANLFHKAIGTMHNSPTPEVLREYHELQSPILCISEAHLNGIPDDINKIGYVHHGIDPTLIPAHKTSAPFLGWLGRFSPEKGAHLGFAGARESGLPLILAGSINDEAYYNEFVRDEIDFDLQDSDLLSSFEGMSDEEIGNLLTRRFGPSSIIYVGRVNLLEKSQLFRAEASLNPLVWSEPFGLVLIESLLSGCPAVATVRVGDIHTGSVKELIGADPCLGYLIDADTPREVSDRIAEGIEHCRQLDRTKIRDYAANRWSSEAQARELLKAYANFISASG